MSENSMTTAQKIDSLLTSRKMVLACMRLSTTADPNAMDDDIMALLLVIDDFLADTRDTNGTVSTSEVEKCRRQASDLLSKYLGDTGDKVEQENEIAKPVSS